MSGKITADGRAHLGERLERDYNAGPAPANDFTDVEIGTGTTAPTVTDTGVETALASGGRGALDSGYPKIETVAGGPELVFRRTYTAGSFTTGTPITEAVVVKADGSKSFGRILLDTAKNPSASEPLEITLKFPINAG